MTKSRTHCISNNRPNGRVEQGTGRAPPVVTNEMVPNAISSAGVRLSEKEQRENLMSVTPGLREDPAAMAILQDIDLLQLYTQNRDNLVQVLQKHPAFGTAATFLAAQFHEEHASAD